MMMSRLPFLVPQGPKQKHTQNAHVRWQGTNPFNFADNITTFLFPSIANGDIFCYVCGKKYIQFFPLFYSANIENSGPNRRVLGSRPAWVINTIKLLLFCFNINIQISQILSSISKSTKPLKVTVNYDLLINLLQS